MTRSDIKALIDRIGQSGDSPRRKKGSPVSANRTFTFARSFFGFCLDHDIDGKPVLDASPAASIKKSRLFPETPRDRVLSDDEIRRLWSATSPLEPFDRVVRILLLTGQRREEVAAMRWSELRLEGPTPSWELPAARSKNKRPHVIPLTGAVISLLPERIHGCEFVFSRRGRVSLNGVGIFKAKLDAVLPIAPWVIHDLRRTAATKMAESLRIAPHIIEAILNHVSGTKGGIAGVYNRARHGDEAREALERWSDHVAALVGDNVRFLQAAE